MRLFQNSALYPSYLPRLNQLAAGTQSFAERRSMRNVSSSGVISILPWPRAGAATVDVTRQVEGRMLGPTRRWRRDRNPVPLTRPSNLPDPYALPGASPVPVPVTS